MTILFETFLTHNAHIFFILILELKEVATSEMQTIIETVILNDSLSNKQKKNIY